MASEKAGLLDQAERQGDGNAPPPPYSDEQGAWASWAPYNQQTPAQPSPGVGNAYPYCGGVTQHPAG